MKIVVLFILLSGCSSIIGNWSGKLGPVKSSLRLNDNGTGLFCYSHNKVNRVEKVEYDGSIIHTERGSELIISSVSDGRLSFEVDSDGVEEYEFKRDTNLKHTSWYCWKKLH